MDKVDITDSTFSLDIPSICKGFSCSSIPTNYIYIGFAVGILIIGIIGYYFYKKEIVSLCFSKGISMCPGGFCNINKAEGGEGGEGGEEEEEEEEEEADPKKRESDNE